LICTNKAPYKQRQGEGRPTRAKNREKNAQRLMRGKGQRKNGRSIKGHSWSSKRLDLLQDRERKHERGSESLKKGTETREISAGSFTRMEEKKEADSRRGNVKKYGKSRQGP